jgi:threonine synthase
MSDAHGRFDESIVDEVPATQSVVLRYRRAVRFAADEAEDARFRTLLTRTSLREGLRIVPLAEYRGVSIDLLDLSSLMASGTLKSIDGCLTAARCLQAGFGTCVFESGGNTGSALTRYCAQAGVATWFFVPAENLDLLESSVFSAPGSHLVAVEDPGQVKPCAEAFAELHDLPRVPKPGWRLNASRLIGCSLLERLLRGDRWDCFVQTISAAFGPIGVYDVLTEHLDGAPGPPRFIGIQQAVNSPMVRAWRAGGFDGSAPPVRATRNLLSRVMYDSAPQTYGTFAPLERLLTTTGGHLDTLDHQEFAAGLELSIEGGSVLEHLERAGVRIGHRGEEILEKAGLIAILGTIKQIERGRIPAGARVLVFLTGGTALPDGRAEPDFVLADARRVAEIPLFGRPRAREESHA